MIYQPPAKGPNFFIAGAVKCGTTSLARYLASHPRIFFSNPKEPLFFATDIEEPQKVHFRDDYLGLFRRATGDHLAVGEGSVFYLYSRVAVGRILEFNPLAKFIVMLRSPIEMASSLHSENFYGRSEDEPDFERAWRRQDERRAGQRIPRLCLEPKELLYGDVCRVGEQLQRLVRSVPRERVLIKTLDELRQDPQAVYEAALAFLEVPSDNRKDFPVYNDNKTWRVTAIASFMTVLGRAKRMIGLRRSLYLGRAISYFNTVRMRRPPVSPEFRSELAAYFRADVDLLSKLVGRDLSAWLEEPRPAASAGFHN